MYIINKSSEFAGEINGFWGKNKLVKLTKSNSVNFLKINQNSKQKYSFSKRHVISRGLDNQGFVEKFQKINNQIL